MEKLRDYSDLPPRLQHEAAFADTAYERWADQLIMSEGMYAKYASPSQRWDWRQYGAMMLGDPRGKAVLDLGCGMGGRRSTWRRWGRRSRRSTSRPSGSN